MQTSSDHPSHAVLTFWLGDGLQQDWPSDDRSPLWFGGGAELDARITEAFGPWVTQALDGGLSDWETAPLPRLALIVLLDQFTRNVFRGQARAFAGDARARALVRHTLDVGEDTTLPWAGRVFLLMPLMHAEDLALQNECLQRFTALQAQAPASLRDRLEGNVRAARQHLDIIERFGRFPHRNVALGRTSTPEEAAFLTGGPRFGQ